MDNVNASDSEVFVLTFNAVPSNFFVSGYIPHIVQVGRVEVLTWIFIFEQLFCWHCRRCVLKSRMVNVSGCKTDHVITIFRPFSLLAF